MRSAVLERLLTAGSLEAIDGWLDEAAQVDLMHVIGTSADLSSQFIDNGRAKRASVAHEAIENCDHVILEDVAVSLPRFVRLAEFGIRCRLNLYSDGSIGNFSGRL